MAPSSPDGYLSTVGNLPPSPPLGSAYGQDATSLPGGPVSAPTFGRTIPLPGEPPMAEPVAGGQDPLVEDGTAADFGVVERFKWRFREDEAKLWIDADNYLSWTTLAEMAAALGTDALLANTPLDQKFQNWFQNHVRSKGTDRFSNDIAFLGHGQDMIPAAIGLTLAGTLVGDNWLGDTVGAYLIGAPSLLLFQYGLGASRPSDNELHGSYWRPFSNSHGASGDAFIGAIPFITAADMTDNYFLKALFFLGSTMVAFERVDVNQHYLSQVVLGWSLGYMAATAVGKTEHDDRAVIFGPVVTPDLVGIGIDIRR
jgi:membrane-associated phospholipid phosphatase